MSCPCGSGLTVEACCERFIKGTAVPETAEQLMRSRYTAYTLGDIAYIKKTTAAEMLEEFDEQSSKEWAKNSEWLGLKVISTKKGQAEDKRGTVEFIVKYRNKGETLEHHEVSEFKKNNQGKWVFLDGSSHTHREGEDHHHHHHPKQETIVRSEPKVGRNDPCVCGSGKKYKKCCGTAA